MLARPRDDCSPRFIEVKTIKGGANTDFFISANEVEFASRHDGASTSIDSTTLTLASEGAASTSDVERCAAMPPWSSKRCNSECGSWRWSRRCRTSSRLSVERKLTQHRGLLEADRVPVVLRARSQRNPSWA